MLFNSYEFIFVFLPITLAGYFCLAHRVSSSAARAWLLVASLVFYGWWNPRYLWLIGGSMIGNFLLGSYLGNPQTTPRMRRIVLTFGVAANLLLLGWYKYAGFFVREAAAIFGEQWTLGNIILPLGVSFFTFLQVAYLVDAAKGKTREYSFENYALFVTFFPHLIAGPIVHHSDLMPQFAKPETFRFDVRRFAAGLTLFTFGLAKKVLIADELAPHAKKIFAAATAGRSLLASDAWAGLSAFTFQIYFDFSGYSDMAIGLGLLFGIMLPFNFDSPYKSFSIVEFWRRWHMTLSRFFRDYLYIPLGGNRHGPTRVCFNLLITMTLAGLWHGANWTFVVWGALHGAALGVNHLWRLRYPQPRSSWWSRNLAWGSTFLFVMLTWALFRAENLTAASHFLMALFGFGKMAGAGMPALEQAKFFIYPALLVILTRLLPNSQQLLEKELPLPVPPSIWHWLPRPRWAVGIGLLFAACALSLGHVSEFIYWQF